jgi:hypothetical protein
MSEMTDDETDVCTSDMPKETAVKALRDPVTGQFLKGTKPGPGRPKGSKDRLNVQVIETLEKLWASRGAEIMDQLAAEKPEVLASLVARLIPQQLAEQAITGSEEKVQTDQQVTIKVVTDQSHDVLPTREVVGELVDDVDIPVH